MNNKPNEPKLTIVAKATPHTDVTAELAELKALVRALHDRPTTVYHITNHQTNAHEGVLNQSFAPA